MNPRSVEPRRGRTGDAYHRAHCRRHSTWATKTLVTLVHFTWTLTSGCKLVDNEPRVSSEQAASNQTAQAQAATTQTATTESKERIERGRGDSIPPSKLRVASWNIEWLHARSGRGPVPRDAADYRRLRSYANQLDADVVALQEVEGEAAARRVFDPSRYSFHFSKREAAQLTGFAFKKQLRVQAHPDFSPLGLGDSLRRGTDISVQLGGTSLRMLSVHLKSGCFGDSLNSGRSACRKLSRQLPILESWIDARAAQQQPFAVLGDFNRRLKLSEAFFSDLNDGNPAGAKLTLVTAGEASNCWGGRYRSYIDHILLGGRASKWLQPNSFFQLTFDAADSDRHDPDFDLSDHCPIRVELVPR